MTIPASITNLGPNTFFNCYNLTGIYFAGNAPALGSLVFNNTRAVVYYLPGTSGWSAAFGGQSAVVWNPQVISNSRLGVQNGQFGFEISGETNMVVAVEAATNLANVAWTPLETLTLTNGSAYFSDSQFTNYPNRFYSFHMPY